MTNDAATAARAHVASPPASPQANKRSSLLAMAPGAKLALRDLSDFFSTSDSGSNQGKLDDGGAGRVLILLEDPAVGAAIAHCLTAAGFIARAHAGWEAGVVEARRFTPDVVLLNSKAPDFSGTAVVRRLREGEKEGHRSAIITLIHDEMDIDPAFGLDLYPCDFLVIPMNARELALRIEEIVRARRGRMASRNAGTRRHYLVGPLELDVDGYTVSVNGLAIHFSTLEMRLLTYLVEHRGRVRTRKQLLEEVWGYNSNVSTRTPDTHVNRLRMKLGVAGELVETIRGMGYRLSGTYPVIVKE